MMRKGIFKDFLSTASKYSLQPKRYMVNEGNNLEIKHPLPDNTGAVIVQIKIKQKDTAIRKYEAILVMTFFVPEYKGLLLFSEESTHSPIK